MTNHRLPILELRHVEPEGPGAYEAALKEYAPITTVRTWCEPIPTHLDFSAIVVMGGPMAAYDGPLFSWIDDEIAYLRRATTAGIPVWGVCLGSQLLAAALGARVYADVQPEVGMTEIVLTEEAKADSVWSGFPPAFSALQWHGDTFELPEGAVRLAFSQQCPNQLYRHGRSYGIQYHLEADGSMAREWLAIDEYAASLEKTLGVGAAKRLLTDVEASEAITVALADRAVRRWLQVVFDADAHDVADRVGPGVGEPSGDQEL